jgi:organizing structure protein 2
LTLGQQPLHAEIATSEDDARKPIYDDVPSTPSLASTFFSSLTPDTPETPARSPYLTPTDRLAGQVSQFRLVLHNYASKLETSADDLLASAFSAERTVSSTIASLAPSRESGEKVMPGVLYVLVAAMGGSVLTRNRNFVLRTITPLAFGITAANVVIPNTTHNVGQLIWRWEQKYAPSVAKAHEDGQARTVKFVATGWEHSKMSAQMLEGKISEARHSIEGWVQKGR